MHAQPVFSGHESFLAGVSDEVFDRGLCLPSGLSLTVDDQQRVVGEVLRRGCQTAPEVPGGSDARSVTAPWSWNGPRRSSTRSVHQHSGRHELIDDRGDLTSGEVVELGHDLDDLVERSPTEAHRHDHPAHRVQSQWFTIGDDGDEPIGHSANHDVGCEVQRGRGARSDRDATTLHSERRSFADRRCRYSAPHSAL